MPEDVTNQPLKGFLTYMEYFATGEGMTIEFLFSHTDTHEEAKEKHLDKFIGNQKESRDYFGAGIDVMPIESDRAYKILDHHFKNAQWLHDQLKTGGIEFYWKYYVNHS